MRTLIFRVCRVRQRCIIALLAQCNPLVEHHFSGPVHRMPSSHTIAVVYVMAGFVLRCGFGGRSVKDAENNYTNFRYDIMNRPVLTLSQLSLVASWRDA